jgi:hypothetical protein
MHIYSSKLEWQDFESIAQAMGVELYNPTHHGESSRGKFAGQAHVSFLLRPRTDLYRAAKVDPYCKAGVRRVWAVSWAGHYVFMRAVLDADPEATIRTSFATYHGSLDFAASAFATGSRNVGPMMEPEQYRNAQAPRHAVWHDETDLVAFAGNVAVRA